MGKRREQILLLLLGVAFVLAFVLTVIHQTTWLIFLMFVTIGLFLVSFLKPMQRTNRQLTQLAKRQAKDVAELQKSFATIVKQNQAASQGRSDIKKQLSRMERAQAKAFAKPPIDLLAQGITPSVQHAVERVKNYRHVVMGSTGTWHEKLVECKLLGANQATVVEMGDVISHGHDVAIRADAILLDINALHGEMFSRHHRWFELFFRWVQPNVPIFVFDPDTDEPLDLSAVETLWNSGMFIISPRGNLLELRIIKPLKDACNG